MDSTKTSTLRSLPRKPKQLKCPRMRTTAYGLHALEKAGFRATLLDAVEAAAARAEELGKSKG